MDSRTDANLKSRRALLYGGLVGALALGVAPAAQARVGTITAINDQAKSFMCDWQGKSWTYGTTDKTAFWLGKSKGSWADLKMGAVVQVSYHLVHGQRVADAVRIQANK